MGRDVIELDAFLMQAEPHPSSLPAVELPFDTRCFATAFGGSRFIDAADGFGMSMFGDDELLTAISQHVLIPDNGLQKSLQRARSHVLIQCDGFGILALDVGLQPSHINLQQGTPRRPSKTTGKMLQELAE